MDPETTPPAEHIATEALVRAAAPAVEELLRERFPIAPYGLPPNQIQVVLLDVAQLAEFVAAYTIGAVRSAIRS